MGNNMEVAAFLPTHHATLNDAEFQQGEFVEFDREAGEIELKNTSDIAIDMLLFGGETYTESVVAEGPFVMNTHGEIADAYRDFYAGKYGKIRLAKPSTLK